MSEAPGYREPHAPRGHGEAVPLAAGIFLDVVNVFLLFLRLLGGGRD